MGSSVQILVQRILIDGKRRISCVMACVETRCKAGEEGDLRGREGEKIYFCTRCVGWRTAFGSFGEQRARFGSTFSKAWWFAVFLSAFNTRGFVLCGTTWREHRHHGSVVFS